MDCMLSMRCPRLLMLLMAKFPIDGGTANAHVNIGGILPSQRLCLDPLVHLARFEKNLTLRCDGDVKRMMGVRIGGLRG